MIRVAILLTVAFSALLAIEAENKINTGSHNETAAFDFKVAIEKVIKTKDSLKDQIIAMTRYMEDECVYMKAMNHYGFIVGKATGIEEAIKVCPVEEGLAELDIFEEAYVTSVKECFEGLTTTSTFDKMVDDRVSDIQTIETNAKTQTEACKDDDKCKQEVNEKTYEAIHELHDDQMPKLKLTYAIAVNDSLTSINECLASKLSNSLQEMNKAIENFQHCMDGLGLTEDDSEADSDEEDSEEQEDENTKADDEINKEKQDTQIKAGTYATSV